MARRLSFLMIWAMCFLAGSGAVVILAQESHRFSPDVSAIIRAAGDIQPDPYGANAAPFFGMNMYLTNPARSDSEVDTLSPMAQAIHVALSREQISWATYATSWGPAFFDTRIGRLADDGFGLIGILVTTPEEYSTAECKACADARGLPRYFCPPANPGDFAAFAAAVVERYDGDGFQDAPGSPRIAYWEIWNEPDQPTAWVTCSGHNDPVAYAALLQATYPAIKGADPSAVVLFGGLTDWDTVGLDDFAERVVQAGGWPYFDILSFHPYILDHPPEEPGQPWNMPARLDMVQNWLASHGGGKGAWATEFGWSTCTVPGDPRCRSEEEQANYLVRAYGLLFLHGFSHGDYFHLKDLYGGMLTPYQECAVIRPDYTTKPAYTAYGVMAGLLGQAHYIGPGQLHAAQDAWSDRYDLLFQRADGARIDLVWQLQGETVYAFRVEPGVQQVFLYDRDGTYQTLTPVQGFVHVTLSERPRYLWRIPTGSVYRTFLPVVYR